MVAASRRKSKAADAARGPSAVVGLGNVGSALAWAMHSAGIPVVELVVREKATARQRNLAKDCGAQLVRFSDWRPGKGQTVWLCVPDDALPALAGAVAERLSQTGKHPRFGRDREAMLLKGPSPSGAAVETTFLHTSGAHSFRDLVALQAAGASIGAAHPFHSFPRPERASLEGTYFAIEGDRRAQRIAEVTVRQIGGIPVRLLSGDKALYHAFGAFASPLLVSLLAAGQELGARAGIPPDVAAKMMASLAGGTFANWQHNGPEKSFSGPIVRGDIETLRLHLASLTGMPEHHAIYRALSIYAAEHLPARRGATAVALLQQVEAKGAEGANQP